MNSFTKICRDDILTILHSQVYFMSVMYSIVCECMICVCVCVYVCRVWCVVICFKTVAGKKPQCD